MVHGGYGEGRALALASPRRLALSAFSKWASPKSSRLGESIHTRLRTRNPDVSPLPPFHRSRVSSWSSQRRNPTLASIIPHFPQAQQTTESRKDAAKVGSAKPRCLLLSETQPASPATITSSGLPGDCQTKRPFICQVRRATLLPTTAETTTQGRAFPVSASHSLKTPPKDVGCVNASSPELYRGRGQRDPTRLSLHPLERPQRPQVCPKQLSPTERRESFRWPFRRGSVFVGQESWEHNFCRNPDGDSAPWCMVSDHQFDLCDVPPCLPPKGTEPGTSHFTFWQPPVCVLWLFISFLFMPPST